MVQVYQSTRPSPAQRRAKYGDPLIDRGQFERDVDAAPPGSIIGVSEARARELIADLRSGHAAMRSVASLTGEATVAIASAGLRVSYGYRTTTTLGRLAFLDFLLTATEGLSAISEWF